MQHDLVLNKLTFDLLITPKGQTGGGGVCGQNICSHVAAFVIPFTCYLIYKMTIP